MKTTCKKASNVASKTKSAKATTVESRKIRVGIIGLGRAGYGMQCSELATRTDKYIITAGCDTFAPRLKRFGEKFPEAKCYKNAMELIADSDVELVSVATRTTTHVEYAIAALKAGKLVFCEKPIATSWAAAKKLFDAAKKCPGKLFIRHNRRFEAAFNDIQAIIDSGILGNVYEIKLNRHGYARRNDWQTVPEEGGGQLLNWGPHIVDHAYQFLGPDAKVVYSELKRVACIGKAEDHVHIVMRNPRGVTCDLQISGGTAKGQSVYWVAGTRGTLVCADEKTIELKYIDPNKKLPKRKVTLDFIDTWGTPDPDLNAAWKTEERKVRTDMDPSWIWDDIYETICTGRPSRVTIEEAARNMKTLSEVRKGAVIQA